MISLNKIIQAKRTISGFVYKTPFAYSAKLSLASGALIYLKEENLQRTGAYKIRGAYNKIANLSAQERKKGVVAASAGNHAQGVAISARAFKTLATIVMPESTPLLKVLGTKDLGAEVILKGDNFDEAYAYAVEYAKQQGMSFIHPFDDEYVMAELETIIVPVGGGGLISGISSCVKQVNPDIRVVAVSAKGAPAMFNSFSAKKSINSKTVRTIADGIAVRDASKTTLANILECVDEFVQVDDEEIANAILFLLETQKIVVEGAGAVGVASILHNKVKFKAGERIGIVLSGGNIDVQMLNVIIEKGLIKSHRKMALQITLIDKPGALMSLTDSLKIANANIVKIDYDRFSTSLEYGDANITITLETKGEDHQELIKKVLREHDFKFIQVF